MFRAIKGCQNKFSINLLFLCGFLWPQVRTTYCAHYQPPRIRSYRGTDIICWLSERDAVSALLTPRVLWDASPEPLQTIRTCHCQQLSLTLLMSITGTLVNCEWDLLLLGNFIWMNTTGIIWYGFVVVDTAYDYVPLR